MDFAYSEKVNELRKRLSDFMDRYIYPNEQTFRDQVAASGNPFHHAEIVDELKAKARAEGLWNLFLPDEEYGAGLTNLEYAPLAEVMGRVSWASEVFNCAAPDTGNMEILAQFGTPEQKERWLLPLLNGEIRSAFAMTEPDVASSDATNIQFSIRREGDEYVLNGRKWWISGAARERCKIFIVMGKTDPNNPDKYRQQSMVLVPRDTPGFTVKRNLTVMGYVDNEGHCELTFENVRVPVSILLGEEGSGFAIAQARLGPGRIHHCMRMVGVAERALELMCKRAATRFTHGSLLADKANIQQWIADSRIEIDATRLMVMHAAWKIDTAGKREARQEIAEIKVQAANMVMNVLDRAIQLHGALGMTDDTPIARFWREQRAMRIVDGPDEVHRMQISRREVRRWQH